MIPVPGDRRSIFVVPWPEGDRTYIGTTDTGYHGDLDDPRCTPEDVAYLLDAVNAATTARLTPDDVTAVWAGLRPLLAPEHDEHLSERTSDLSRRHSVTRSAPGVVTVTGGKLTTYRRMAEDTVDVALRELAGTTAGPCVTKRQALRGARGSAETVPEGITVPAALVTHLSARYGDEYGAVLAVAAGRPELLLPVVDGLPYVGAEIVYAARHEMARTVADVLDRRTRALLLDARLCAHAAPSVASLLAAELGWTADQEEAEAARFVDHALGELASAGLGRAATRAPQV